MTFGLQIRFQDLDCVLVQTSGTRFLSHISGSRSRRRGSSSPFLLIQPAVFPLMQRDAQTFPGPRTLLTHHLPCTLENTHYCRLPLPRTDTWRQEARTHQHAAHVQDEVQEIIRHRRRSDRKKYFNVNREILKQLKTADQVGRDGKCV